MCRECLGFGTFRGLERRRGGERKEEDLKQKYADKSMMAAGLTFLFICMGNVSVFEVLWEWMREIEGKEDVLVWHFIIKSGDLLLFWERIWGEERKEEDLVRVNPTRS